MGLKGSRKEDFRDTLKSELEIVRNYGYDNEADKYRIPSFLNGAFRILIERELERC